VLVRGYRVVPGPWLNSLLEPISKCQYFLPVTYDPKHFVPIYIGSQYFFAPTSSGSQSLLFNSFCPQTCSPIYISWNSCVINNQEVQISVQHVHTRTTLPASLYWRG
jgi:hypothetical protein